MSRSHKLYLQDIIKAGKNIQDYIQDLDESKFKSDELRIDAVLFNLMTIGEAIKNIPQEEQDKYPDVRWRDIARFRDRLVHHYFKLDIAIIWEIIQVHLPILLKHVQEMLDNYEDNN